MNPVVAVLVGLLGVALGLGSGWVAVHFEHAERLEAEEEEDRRAWEKELAEKRVAAERDGTAPPEEQWDHERYGWTWLERVLSPGLAGVLYLLFALHDGASRELPLHLLWLLVFVHIAAFDIKHHLILNRVTFPGVAVALALSLVTPELGLVRALAAAVVLLLFFAVPSLAFRGRAMGLGDAKLGALIGAVTGLGLDFDHLASIYALMYGITLGGVGAVLLLVLRVRRLKDPIPYGPFLCAGAVVVLWHGLTGW